MSLVFAVFTVGYIVGVWTACLVFKKPQRTYEDGAGGLPARKRMVVLAAEPVRIDRMR